MCRFETLPDEVFDLFLRKLIDERGLDLRKISKCTGPIVEAWLAGEKVTAHFLFEEVSIEKLIQSTQHDLAFMCTAKSVDVHS